MNPELFLVGHKQQKSLLRSAYQHNRRSHALLILGDSGIGKTKFALWIALLYNCIKTRPETELSEDSLETGVLFSLPPTEPADEPCFQCSSCQKILANSHPDVYFLAPESTEQSSQPSIRVEQIREVKRSLYFSPHEGRSRVILIDDAHKMNVHTQNGLLKILEEPPANTYFILVTSEKTSLLPTVVSRSQSFYLGPLEPEEMTLFFTPLKGISKNEQALLIALSQGRPGLLLNSLDGDSLENSSGRLSQMIHSSRLDPTQLNIFLDERKERIVKTLALFKTPYSEISKLIDSLSKSSDDSLTLFSELQQILRDLTNLKIGGEPIWNPDFKEELKTLSEQISFPQILQLSALLNRSASDIERNLNKKALTQHLLSQIKSFGV